MKFEFRGMKIDTGDRPIMLFSEGHFDIRFKEFEEYEWLNINLKDEIFGLYPF